MKPFYFLPLISLFFVACGDTATESFEPDAEADPSTLTLTQERLANANLTIVEAAAAEIGEKVVAYGEITLNTDKVASIPARIDGVIADDRTQLGATVAAGDVLAVIESQTLATAIVMYLQTERDMRFARAEYQREKELFDKKLASSESYYGKEQAFGKAQIAHAAALQPLELLNFEEGQLHDYLENPDAANLTHFEVRAPLAGVVTKKKLIKGESVSADQELFVVADLSEVWVDFQVALSDASFLTEGQNVSVGGSGSALVQYVAPVANQANRTVEARAVMANAEGAWRPGTPVTVGFARGRETFPVTVPAAAVLDFEGGFAVFVRQSADTFELREVKTGKLDNERVAIAEGLNVGEKVASDGAYQLKAQWGMGEE